MSHHDLTPDQLQALRDYAAHNGRHWKNALNADWLRARTTGHLQSLRNTHGPRWLARFKSPEAGE
jgi:hypothetical protein